MSDLRMRWRRHRAGACRSSWQVTGRQPNGTAILRADHRDIAIVLGAGSWRSATEVADLLEQAPALVEVAIAVLEGASPESLRPVLERILPNAEQAPTAPSYVYPDQRPGAWTGD